MMITDKTLVHGIDADSQMTARARVALIQATKDNVDRLMTYLEQSRKNATQLKETIKKERDECNKLKRKFEDMHKEVRASKAELQILQVLQLQLFPKFSKILGPPFKVCLAWICFGRLNYIVFATNLDHKVDLRSIVFLSVRSRTVNAFNYETQHFIFSFDSWFYHCQSGVEDRIGVLALYVVIVQR